MKKVNLINLNHVVAFLVTLTFSMPILAETAQADSSVACDATMVSASTRQLSATHATVHSSILIDATAADVWSVLTNFEAMPNWSTGTLQGMVGDIENGGQVVITFRFGKDEKGEPIENKIPHTLIYAEGEIIGWSDPFPADIGGGNDNHIYRVQPCGEKTLFVQSDEIVNNPYAANFVTQLLPMYQLFNTELKTAVERSVNEDNRG